MRSRVGYWIGAGLIVAGVLGAIAWAGFTADRLIDRIARFENVPIPGREQVPLERRKYVVYVEGPGADENVPAFDMTVTDAEREQRLALRRYRGSLTYSFNTTGAAVATMTPARAGVYDVRTDGPPGYRVVIGETIASDLTRAVGGALGIGLGGGAGGVALLIATAIRRSRPAEARVV